MTWKSTNDSFINDIFIELTKEQKRYPIQNDYDLGYFMGLATAKMIIIDLAWYLKDRYEVED